jgi:hypothetical protein
VPRRRAVDEAANHGSAPAELFDRGSEHWVSAVSLRSWLSSHGLHSSAMGWPDDGPARHRAKAIDAWLRANGCAHERWPHGPLDWHKVAAIGLDFGPWKREELDERLARVELKEN